MRSKNWSESSTYFTLPLLMEYLSSVLEKSFTIICLDHVSLLFFSINVDDEALHPLTLIFEKYLEQVSIDDIYVD